MIELIKCRKESVCETCTKPIVKGEQYVKRTQVKSYIPSLGRPLTETWKYHKNCYYISDLSCLQIICSDCKQQIVYPAYITKEGKIRCIDCDKTIQDESQKAIDEFVRKLSSM